MSGLFVLSVKIKKLSLLCISVKSVSLPWKEKKGRVCHCFWILAIKYCIEDMPVITFSIFIFLFLMNSVIPKKQRSPEARTKTFFVSIGKSRISEIPFRILAASWWHGECLRCSRRKNRKRRRNRYEHEVRYLSRAGHEKPCLNPGRPRSKAKYSTATDSE